MARLMLVMILGLASARYLHRDELQVIVFKVQFSVVGYQTDISSI